MLPVMFSADVCHKGFQIGPIRSELDDRETLGINDQPLGFGGIEVVKPMIVLTHAAICCGMTNDCKYSAACEALLAAVKMARLSFFSTSSQLAM